MSFFQDAPLLSNLYSQDDFFQAEFLRRVPEKIAAAHIPALKRLGKKSAEQFYLLQKEAEKYPPTLTNYNAWGKRVDEMREACHWQEFRREAIEWGIVARGNEKELGRYARVVQTAYMLLFSPTTANYLCPLAMADAAACVLRRLAPASLKNRLYGRLISRDINSAITSGQWMTERSGGSDVSQTETIARFQISLGEEERYLLHGVKWFCSSITSEMSVLLAQVLEGDSQKGLTLFCWERPESGNSYENGMRILRLKDKLGTRALPTAEIELDGAVCTRIGEIGRGVGHITEMLNITRFYNAVASAASMNFSSLLVEDYSRRRRAFGHSIGQHALMKEVLADLRTQSAAATALGFEVANLIGLCESGEANKDQQLCMRALVPLAKLLLGKAAVAHASETLECFGGAGYIEDTGLPRILRDAQVFPIWEGTTNILALDVWRAERKEGAASALAENILIRSEKLMQRGIKKASQLHSVAKSLCQLIDEMKLQPDEDSHRQLRKLAFDLGGTLQKLLLLEHEASAGEVRDF